MKETCLHRPLVPPLAGLVRGSEFAEDDVFMENREIPILHKIFPAMVISCQMPGKLDQLGWRFFVCPALAGQTKKVFSVTSLPAGRQVCLCGESKRNSAP